MRAVIAVPATSANLGAGFDIFGVALQMQNEVEAVQTDTGTVALELADDDPPHLHDPGQNLVAVAYRSACDELGVSVPSVLLRCVNRIPLKRGLGSSAAAALAGTLAACALHGAPWDENRVLDHVTALEGHRDNASAALLGGLTISAPGAPTVNMPVPEELRAVLYVPDMELATKTARVVVADAFSRDSAIYNASRCALLVRAIALHDHGTLRIAMQDCWHQVQRTPLFPALPALIAAALDGGAHGAALSGAGPTVIAFASEHAADVEASLTVAAESAGIEGRAVTLPLRNWGARVDVHGS